MAGSNASFSVTVPSGIPLSYQWFYDQTNAIAGATGSSLVLGNVQLTDAGSYSVSVSNAYGSVNSEAASLTVWVAPAISAAPQSLTLLAGQDAVFNVGATGTEPLVYQWQFNGTNLVDATDATLILTNVTTDQAGAYGVTVTNLAGIASASATFVRLQQRRGGPDGPAQLHRRRIPVHHHWCARLQLRRRSLDGPGRLGSAFHEHLPVHFRGWRCHELPGALLPFGLPPLNGPSEVRV